MQVFTSTTRLARLVMDTGLLADRFGAAGADAIDLWLDRLDTASNVADLVGYGGISKAVHGEELVEALTARVNVVLQVIDDESVLILDVRGRS